MLAIREANKYCTSREVNKDYSGRIQKAMNKNRHKIKYRVTNVGPNKYVARCGSEVAYFLFLSRYFSYDITIEKRSVVVTSTVPLGGFLSGGFIGMHRTHDETNAVRRRLHAAFPTRSINGKQI